MWICWRVLMKISSKESRARRLTGNLRKMLAYRSSAYRNRVSTQSPCDSSAVLWPLSYMQSPVHMVLVNIVRWWGHIVAFFKTAPGYRANKCIKYKHIYRSQMHKLELYLRLFFRNKTSTDMQLMPNFALVLSLLCCGLTSVEGAKQVYSVSTLFIETLALLCEWNLSFTGCRGG